MGIWVGTAVAIAIAIGRLQLDEEASAQEQDGIAEDSGVFLLLHLQGQAVLETYDMLTCHDRHQRSVQEVSVEGHDGCEQDMA